MYLSARYRNTLVLDMIDDGKSFETINAFIISRLIVLLYKDLHADTENKQA